MWFFLVSVPVNKKKQTNKPFWAFGIEFVCVVNFFRCMVNSEFCAL